MCASPRQSARPCRASVQDGARILFRATPAPLSPPSCRRRMKADAMSRRCLAANALALLAVPNRDAFAAGLRPALGPGRFRATRFEGEYSDLLHPLCDRKIAVDTSALKQSGGGDYFLATFSGNDIGPPGGAASRCPLRGSLPEICSQYRRRQCRQGLLRRGERLPVRAARLELRGAHLG